MIRLDLPRADGTLAPYALRAATTWPAPSPRPPWNRVAFAAAHVVADPLAAVDPWLDAAIDWDTTLAFRHHLWSLGFGVAEAMDTAQRGMGLDWSTSLELIQRSVAEARTVPGAVVFSGAGTDHLPPTRDVTLDQVIAAYDEQCAAVEGAGGRIILMASRALAACARSPDDYARVYGRVLSQVRAAGHHALAGRDVRSSTRRLLGRRGWTCQRSAARARHGRVRQRDRRQRRQGRWRQGVPARCQQGDRAACPPAGRRAHVYRRRLQFRRADRWRCERAFRCAARHFRCDRAGRVGRAERAGRAATARTSTRYSRRPCRCPGTSLPRRRASTRPASCSWPGSTATSRISR